MKWATALLLLLLAAPAHAHHWIVIWKTDGNQTDTTTANATAISGLRIPALASTKVIAHCYVIASSTATSNAIRLSADAPAGITSITTTVTTQGDLSAGGTIPVEVTSVNTDAGASNNTVSNGTTRTINRVDVFLDNGSTAGNLDITFNTETGGNPPSVTVYTGSWCEYRYQRP